MIGIVDYGAGNLRSVEFALERIGVAHVRAAHPREARGVRGLILPGVGAAGSAMAALESTGWAAELRALSTTTDAPPLLGICLGMQLLFEASEEGDRPAEGLGLIPGRTRRFAGPAFGTDGLAVPHMGWNRVRARPEEPLFRGAGGEAFFYFLHAYRVECAPEPVIATSEYGDTFPAAVRVGRVAGVQFHPEKSGIAGSRVLGAFCAGCGAC